MSDGSRMAVYDPDETGPCMLLELPVVVVDKLIEIAYREFTPARHGLDGAFVAELRAQRFGPPAAHRG